MASNPAEEFLGLQHKEASKRAQDDLDLWHSWNKGGRTAELMQPLLKKYEPFFARKTREWKAPAVAPAAFNAELKKHFVEAAKTFDPERGVAFNTHMQYRVQKAKRYNAKYQNVGYIPEGQAEHIGDIQAAQNELNEQFGRAPTAAELAEHLDLPEHKVTTVLKALRNDIPSSRFESDPFEFGTSRESDVVRLMQRKPEEYFTPDESTVFNHIYGVNGHKKITDTTGLAKQLSVSMPKVSRLKTSIADKIKKHI